MESCQRRLSGGYISLLFSVAAGTEAGRELLANAGLWHHLAGMGSQVRQALAASLALRNMDRSTNEPGRVSSSCR